MKKDKLLRWGLAAAAVALVVVLVGLVVYLGVSYHAADRQLCQLQADLAGSGGAGAALPPRPVAALLREKTFDEARREADGVIAAAFAAGHFDGAGPAAGGARVAGACRLALGGGKRLRPVIVAEIARALSARRHAETGAAPADPAEAALAAECFHAASLVIDDLPTFDNDATRRGSPAVWAATSPQVALMSSVALFGVGIESICRQFSEVQRAARADERRPLLQRIKPLARFPVHFFAAVGEALGPRGAPAGQLLDVTAGCGPAEVQDLTRRKTAPFYEIAFVGGWLAGGGDPSRAGALRAAGAAFGEAFQVADDLGDLAQDRARRATGKGVSNFADALGEEAAVRAVASNLGQARSVLEKEGIFTPLWEEIYSKVIALAAGWQHS